MVVGLTTSKRTPPTTSRMPSRPLRMIATAKARSSRSPLLNQFTESGPEVAVFVGYAAVQRRDRGVDQLCHRRIMPSSNPAPAIPVDGAWPGPGARLDESQDDPARPDRGYVS